MPFAYVMQNLQPGMAAKRPSWNGYVKKTVATGAEEGSYSLTFKKRDGTENKYDVTATGITVASGSSAVLMDPELLAAMLSDDWITGSIDTFESARSGSGTW